MPYLTLQNSIASILLFFYRWLSMNYNQYEHYSVKGGRRAEQVEAYRNPSISIKELREMTDTINEYKLMHQFTERILKEPLEEINAHTSLMCPMRKSKKGVRLIALSFILRRNAWQTITVTSWTIGLIKKIKHVKLKQKTN